MDFFWSNIFEHFKERRHAAIFLCALVIAITGLALGAIFCQVAGGLHYLLQGWPYILSGIGLLLAGIIWKVLRSRRAAKLNRYNSSPLSRNEIRKARSKLKTKSTHTSS